MGFGGDRERVIYIYIYTHTFYTSLSPVCISSSSNRVYPFRGGSRDALKGGVRLSGASPVTNGHTRLNGITRADPRGFPCPMHGGHSISPKCPANNVQGLRPLLPSGLFKYLFGCFLYVVVLCCSFRFVCCPLCFSLPLVFMQKSYRKVMDK